MRLRLRWWLLLLLRHLMLGWIRIRGHAVLLAIVDRTAVRVGVDLREGHARDLLRILAARAVAHASVLRLLLLMMVAAAKGAIARGAVGEAVGDGGVGGVRLGGGHVRHVVVMRGRVWRVRETRRVRGPVAVGGERARGTSGGGGVQRRQDVGLGGGVLVVGCEGGDGGQGLLVLVEALVAMILVLVHGEDVVVEG